jgi:hypothetical protein
MMPLGISSSIFYLVNDDCIILRYLKYTECIYLVLWLWISVVFWNILATRHGSHIGETWWKNQINLVYGARFNSEGIF